jgi:hypothetical protein
MPATLNALSAKGTPVEVITKDKPFGLFIQHDQIDGVGRAIHGTQLATDTFLRIPPQPAA